MKNLKDQITEKLEKCPYQVLAYGETNCDVIYRTSYKGDWGDWDEPIQNSLPNLEEPEVILN